MQVLEGSIVYRLPKKLSQYYRCSKTKSFFAALARYWKNSLTVRFFCSFGKLKQYYRYSFVSCAAQGIRRGLSSLYRGLDSLLLRLSGLLREWSCGSLLCVLFRFVARASKEKVAVFAAPVFGIGYFVGRLLFNRLRIRDVLFIVLTFFAAGVLAAGREKLKRYFRESLFYRLYLLVLG